MRFDASVGKYSVPINYEKTVHTENTKDAGKKLSIDPQLGNLLNAYRTKLFPELDIQKTESPLNDINHDGTGIIPQRL